MNTSKVTSVVLSIVFAASLSACTINTGGSGEDTSAPDKESTEPTEDSAEETMYAALEEVWPAASADQEELCTYFNLSSDLAYDAFNDSWEKDINAAFPRDVFDDFFESHC